MLHLIKLCVGVSSVADLQAYEEERFQWARDYGPDLHRHRTRQMPKRADEITGIGSLYWVIGGLVQCRQAIVGLRTATRDDGIACCDILLRPELIRTAPYPRQPFQGWRYLKAEDAPPDLDAGVEGNGELVRELAVLGLI